MKAFSPCIEPLETRIAPASVLVFVDLDGDKIKVTSSAGDLNAPGVAAFMQGGSAGGQQLILLTLTDASFQGASIATSITKSAGGDGFVNIGQIDATGRDLGSVTIHGDLGDIDCGDAETKTPALRSLAVRSMGRYGLATQGGAGDLFSQIHGPLGGVKIAADLAGASLFVSGSPNTPDGTIGFVTIGGSLIGGVMNSSGEIFCTGTLGPVKIGGDMLGGSGSSSGGILAFGKIASLTIDGSFLGGAGIGSGFVSSSDQIGPVKIGRDFLGSAGSSSALISSSKAIGPITIGGTFAGGGGQASGGITAESSIGFIKIGGDLLGGAGDESGKIDATGAIAGVTIGGSLIGGSGNQNTRFIGTTVHAGQIFAEKAIGLIRIHGDVKGGAGAGSGAIWSNTDFAGITIGASLIGGLGDFSALLRCAGLEVSGPIVIGSDMIGGGGFDSGSITYDGGIAGITVGGSQIGGAGTASGFIGADGKPAEFVKIGRDLVGGSGAVSGAIGGVKVLTIGGSVLGGSGTRSGAVFNFGNGIVSVRIGHDLVGGSIGGAQSALDGSGSIESDQRIGSVLIGGSIIAGTDGSSAGSLTLNGSIRAGDDIGALTVQGALVGNVSAGGDSFVIISARGQAVQGAGRDAAIGKIEIGGRVEFAQIFAGYDTALVGKNADAQIGVISVGGDWAASSVVAGAVNLGQDNLPGGILGAADNVDFGNFADAKIINGTDTAGIVSKLGSVTIAGQVFGTPNSFANLVSAFGFVAEKIDAFKVGGIGRTLNPGPNNDGKGIGPTENIALHEIGALFGSTVRAPIAARLVNGSTVAYTDRDGDQVTVRLSKPLLNSGNVNTIFTFDTGSIDGGLAAFQQLERINLAALHTDGLSLAITVKTRDGDGLANVGDIDSTGFDLGSVIVPGDLGRIEAGNADAKPAIGLLSVRTMGRLATDTQPPASAGFAPGLQSDILGDVGFFLVRQDLVGAVFNDAGFLRNTAIGGSVIGGPSAGGGSIFGISIGAMKIGAHLQGGAGGNSALIATASRISLVSIGGSLIGGAMPDSGRIVTDGEIGQVTIAHNLLGGAELHTGRIEGSRVVSVTVGGSIAGGLGASSAQITSYMGGDTGTVKISHNLLGGAGLESGTIKAGRDLGSVSVGASVIGGLGLQSGALSSSRSMGFIQIGHNLAGAAASSGSISAGSGNDSSIQIAGLSIGGSLVGGMGFDAGFVNSAGLLGPCTIGGSILGGSADDAGVLSANGGDLASLRLGGSLVGGRVGSFTGAVFSRGGMGLILIKGNVAGGAGSSSGEVLSFGALAGVAIDGSLLGGTGNGSGELFSNGAMGPIRIGGNLTGGSITGADSLTASGFIGSREGIKSVSMSGSIFSGTDNSTGALFSNATIRAGDDIGLLVIKGSLAGNSTPMGESPVIIAARGQASPGALTDLALRSASIGGRVELAQLLAGYDIELMPKNADAQIGPVKVRGDWAASILSAGAIPNGSGIGGDLKIAGPGVTDSAAIVSKISSIIIGGRIFGTPAADLTLYDLVAEQIDFARIGAAPFALKPGPHNDFIFLGTTSDVVLVEL